jgi:hypothetical protein
MRDGKEIAAHDRKIRPKGTGLEKEWVLHRFVATEADDASGSFPGDADAQWRWNLEENQLCGTGLSP